MGYKYKIDDSTGKTLGEELEKYKCIFSKNLYNYLESIVNLEVSALRQDNITSEQVSALSEFKIFKEILYYNICARALKYKESDNVKYYVDDFWKTFGINYGDVVNNVSLINVNQTDSYNVNVSLGYFYEPTFEDVVMSYNDKIESLEESIASYRKNFRGTNGSSNSEELCKRLKNYSLEDLEKIWIRELEFTKRQNDFYKKFMDDTNLEYTSDFELMNDGSLILAEDASKIYIKKQVKTPIYR